MRNHTPTALPVRLTALAALGFLAVACGNAPEEEIAPATGPEAAENDAPAGEGEGLGPGTEVDLTIARFVAEDGLTPEEGFEEGTWTLTCSPAGGDHPDPEAACAVIEEIGVAPFQQDTSEMMCTQIMGGPEAATVTGTIGDARIDTEFNKQNGCEIERYESLGAVLHP